MIIGIIVILAIALFIAVIILRSIYSNEAFVTIEKSNKECFVAEVQKYAEVGYYPISDCVIDGYGNYKIHLKKRLENLHRFTGAKGGKGDFLYCYDCKLYLWLGIWIFCSRVAFEIDKSKE
ncbi:hypothetical protein HCN_1622 [Helicobacter cinaedi PAGU611]|uniref:Uncharacterized protein n=1 Tax=Helicobacter cinaedi CCUG 18818 = ATCC BAA-847 TaxID=537971 RepID=A0AAI8QHU5_9HELI|nr:hypothetical protein [Helicobacter cinaedi]EFR45735.1 hypothetical protein HCCG_00281 [Helicobacter cinaedi CCUG 18818 = ATCC BAA-847]QOQ90977.1 hypothetical protein HW260_01010 [Helicobacter cinaedi]BAM12806.1 hypothetical protein HCN_1622 [Helicobacter cinaedi PAGU611]BAM33103.1 hypothetical protein HCBAA847_1883 [Helicobacter cinaedi CCUG 18818 = ATCC BAA-847]